MKMLDNKPASVIRQAGQANPIVCKNKFIKHVYVSGIFINITASKINIRNVR